MHPTGAPPSCRSALGNAKRSNRHPRPHAEEEGRPENRASRRVHEFRCECPLHAPGTAEREPKYQPESPRRDEGLQNADPESRRRPYRGRFPTTVASPADDRRSRAIPRHNEELRRQRPFRRASKKGSLKWGGARPARPRPRKDGRTAIAFPDPRGSCAQCTKLGRVERTPPAQGWKLSVSIAAGGRHRPPARKSPRVGSSSCARLDCRSRRWDCCCPNSR